MYKTINGFTKAKMLEVIQARPFTERAKTDRYCVYLTPDGNKCGVGLFLPEGHEAQKASGSSEMLFHAFPDLKEKMPLDEEGMRMFQFVHDGVDDLGRYKGNAKQAMIDWVEKHVEDDKAAA